MIAWLLTAALMLRAAPPTGHPETAPPANLTTSAEDPAATADAGASSVPDPTAKALYGDKCAGCHGADGRAQTMYGAKHPMPHFNSAHWQQSTSEADIGKAIAEGISKNGHRLMPAFQDKLSADQIAALGAYLRTFKP